MNLKKTFILIFLSLGITSLAMSQEDGQMSLRLTLKDALESVDTINLQVMMANARLEQAIAHISQAQSDLLPHFEGDVSGGRQTADLRAEGIQIPIPGFSPEVKPYNNFDARLRVSIALFDPSSIERFQAAKKGEVLSKAELEKTREDVLALVASLFIDAQRKQEAVRLLKILLDRDQMAYQLSEDSLNQGTDTELHSNQFKTNLDQTKYLYAQVKQQAQDALLDLVAALQLPTNAPVIFLNDDIFSRKLENNASINFSNATNADMEVALSQLEARRVDQKTAYADFLPKISGAANYGRSGESSEHGSNTYFVGAQVSVPLWEGGAQQAQLRKVKGEVKEAEENLQDASQQEQVNVAKARVAIVETYDLREAKFQALQTMQKSLRIALHAEEIGSGTVLEVMQAKADLAIAEDDYNEAQAAWVMAHIDLLHAQGRLRDLIKK